MNTVKAYKGVKPSHCAKMRKYDAAKPSEPSQPNWETDLGRLGHELVRVVQKAMQPVHVSLWLHPDTALKSEK
jgi:hypothetical protein